MTDKYQIIKQDIELEHEYSSNASTSILSNGPFTGSPVLNFKVWNPLVLLRKLDFVSVESDDSWFKESEWLDGENEVEDNLKNGLIFRFEKAEDAITFLRSNR